VIRVLVLDRSRVFAEALAARLELEADIAMVMTPSGAAGAMAMLSAGVVDVALCDEAAAEQLVSGPGWAKLNGSAARLVVLADPANCGHAARLVQAGIAGWATRDQSVEVLLATIRGAVRGETWIPPSLLTQVLADLTTVRRQHRVVQDRLAVLTEREREILELLGEGLDRDEVADMLHLSRHTVRTHLQNIRSHLAVHSTLAAVAVARAGRSGVAAAG
jgi:DNA-binding NarL/FixJ family response regulator